MNTWLRLASQIGGPNALTIWTWLITLPLTVMVSSVYSEPPTLGEVVTWSAALVLIQGVLGLVMLLARVTVLPKGARRPRPVTALAVFAGLGFARAELLTFAQERLGLGSFDETERLVFNIIAALVVYSVIAVVVDEFKSDAAIVRRLASAQSTLKALREQETTSLQEMDARILSDVGLAVERELASEGVDGARIREISESVVRGVSHELVQPSSPEGSSATRAQPWWQTLAAIVQRMRVPPPLAVVIPIHAAAIGALTVRYGASFALWNAILGSMTTIVGLWLMRRYIPLPRAAVPRLTVLVAGISLVGTVAVPVNAWVMTELFEPYAIPLLPTVVAIVGIALLVSMGIAVAEGRADRRAEMTQAVANEVQETTRIQGLIDERRRAAARFLHGSVQNELVAASLRGDSPEQVRSTLESLFSSYVSGEPDGQAREALEGLLGSWSAVLEVTSLVDEDVWSVIAADPTRGKLLVDVVSEGLTNAVRHSSDRVVDVRVRAEGDCVIVRVASLGLPASGSVAGIGLTDLRERGAQPTLTLNEDSTVLEAVV